jgi:hypothetical protein
MIKKRKIAILIMGFILVFLVTGCGGASARLKSPEKAVESYLNALVNKDSDNLSILSCADWEASALMEFDSLQAVTVRLDGLACTKTGEDGNYSLVNCIGKIVATYNGEDQNIELSPRIYKVVNQNDEYLVCGYQ